MPKFELWNEEEVTRARKDLLDAQADADRARVEASNLQKELKIKVEAYERVSSEAAERDVQRESGWAELKRVDKNSR